MCDVDANAMGARASLPRLQGIPFLPGRFHHLSRYIVRT